MARLCARPGCSAPAAVTFNFDGLNRVVWLNGLGESAACSAGDLCWRHAEEFHPPRNWEVRDQRPAHVLPASAAAPSRQLPPTPPNGHPDDAATGEPGLVPGVEEPVSTPLLARAFRGVTKG